MKMRGLLVKQGIVDNSYDFRTGYLKGVVEAIAGSTIEFDNGSIAKIFFITNEDKYKKILSVLKNEGIIFKELDIRWEIKEND